jgi:hypothetical protein
MCGACIRPGCPRPHGRSLSVCRSSLCVSRPLREGANGWIPGNLCDLSKGYFTTTFLSSSPTTSATQSGLCEPILPTSRSAAICASSAALAGLDIATAIAPADPTSPTAESQLRNLQAAARALGSQLHILHASTERDFNAVFATLSQLRPSGLVIASDTFFATHSEQLAALTVRQAVPAIHQSRDFTIAGGLMSYGHPNASGCENLLA